MILKDELFAFNRIQLNEAKVSIPNRSDRKYVIHLDNLSSFLKSLQADYDLLEINNSSVLRYETTYFDTKNYMLYLEHHNSFYPRTKIRKRNYLNSNDLFLELKRKTNRSITYKIRTQIKKSLTPFEFDDFVSQYLSINSEDLAPTLINKFDRLFLVKKDKSMRMTIDIKLQVKDQRHNYINLFPNLAIIEIKADKNRERENKQQIVAFGAIKTRFSKYCLGLIKLNPEIKHNCFKPTLHLLNKIDRNKLF